jgi:DNA-binding IclR family transcriptional regulator
MGLLYKDPVSRTFSPTPRLGTLGASAQPEILKDGRFYALMDRLAQSTRYGVALFGLVGMHTQIFRWSPGADLSSNDLCAGASELLSNSAAGLLLVSTQGVARARKVLWRLNAEASPEDHFNYADSSKRMENFAKQRWATGEAGFVADARVAAVLLRNTAGEQPLALGVMYPDGRDVDVAALVATLRHGVAQCAAAEAVEAPNQPATLMRAVSTCPGSAGASRVDDEIQPSPRIAKPAHIWPDRAIAAAHGARR